jgi:hypothetical protein
MENITSPADLKNAILLLEAEQAIHLLHVKEKFSLTSDSLKPSKLIVSALKDIASTPYLVNNVLITASGLVSGYYSQKVITGKSGSKLRKLFGYMIQYGITNLIAQNPKAIKFFGQYIFQHVFPKKEVNTANRD